jgi:cell division protein FtsB
MKQSFIKPRKKSFITSELQLVFYFFGITLFMLFFTYSTLTYKTYAFKNDIEYMKKTHTELKDEIKNMNNQIAFINKEVAKAELVHTTNTVLQESIKNLFDLIPDKIVLSRVQMELNSLVLHGVTPSKDVYEFMLHAPLRSIFHRTYSSFYQIENGWYRFVSTNYLDQNADDLNIDKDSQKDENE